MATAHPHPDTVIPRWLRFVLKCDRAGSSWYIGTGFFFAPVLALVSPWPALTTALWGFIALAGLWLGLLGVAMATGLAIVLRADVEIPEDYWRSILDYPHSGREQLVAQQLGQPAGEAATGPAVPADQVPVHRRVAEQARQIGCGRTGQPLAQAAQRGHRVDHCPGPGAALRVQLVP